MDKNPAATGALVAPGLARKQPSQTSPGDKSPPSAQENSSCRRCLVSVRGVTDQSGSQHVSERAHIRTRRTRSDVNNIDGGATACCDVWRGSDQSQPNER